MMAFRILLLGIVMTAISAGRIIKSEDNSREKTMAELLCAIGVIIMLSSFLLIEGVL